MLAWRNCDGKRVGVGRFFYSKRGFNTKDTKDTKEEPLLG